MISPMQTSWQLADRMEDYNGNIELFRAEEYPMLKGQFTTQKHVLHS